VGQKLQPADHRVIGGRFVTKSARATTASSYDRFLEEGRRSVGVARQYCG
jgi:SRSO17 transposase